MNKNELDLVDGLSAFHATLKAKNDFLQLIASERERYDHAVRDAEQQIEKFQGSGLWEYRRANAIGAITALDELRAKVEGK